MMSIWQCLRHLPLAIRMEMVLTAIHMVFEDLGIRNHIIGGNRRFDIEKVMENAVYIHLNRMGYKVYGKSFLKGGALGKTGKFSALPRPLPLTDSPGRGRWHEVPEGE